MNAFADGVCIEVNIDLLLTMSKTKKAPIAGGLDFSGGE